MNSKLTFFLVNRELSVHVFPIPAGLSSPIELAPVRTNIKDNSQMPKLGVVTISAGGSPYRLLSRSDSIANLWCPTVRRPAGDQTQEDLAVVLKRQLRFPPFWNVVRVNTHDIFAPDEKNYRHQERTDDHVPDVV